KATQIKADDPTTWFHWGNLEKNLANYSNARRYLNRALELVENTASVLIALGNVEKQDSNFTKAIEILDEVISDLEATHTTITDRELIVASTSLADTYYRWAEAYERDNQIDFAVEKATSSYEIMNKVAALGSNDAKTRETRMKCLLLLGRLHNKKNNPSAARHFLEEIISMEMNPRI